MANDVIVCLNDLYVFLEKVEGWCLDYVWGWDVYNMLLHGVWIGKHELDDGLLCMILVLWKLSDWLVNHVQSVSRA